MPREVRRLPCSLSENSRNSFMPLEAATLSLSFLRTTCSQASADLTIPESQVDAAFLNPIPSPALHQDLLSLLSLVYTAVTKISLALRPTDPSWTASLAPLKELTAYVAALMICASRFTSTVHGSALREDVVSSVKHVICGIEELAGVFVNQALGSGNTQDYLLRTAEVHELIESAKSVPQNNAGAVKTRLSSDINALEDAWREVGEMAVEHDAEGESSDIDYEIDDDGWAGLGMTAAKMDRNERERTQNVCFILSTLRTSLRMPLTLQVQSLLRYVVLLQKQVIVLLPSSSQSNLPNLTLDQLPFLSSKLTSTTDDLVSALYPPQDSLSILEELKSWLQNIKTLETTVSRMLDEGLSLEDQMGNMNLSAGVDQKTGATKWFDTCFNQIYVVAMDLERSLAS
jgi:hypothetical protein